MPSRSPKPGTPKPRSPAHRWAFIRSFRPNAFGWRASALAAKRLQEAIGEIRSVARSEPVIAGEGAVRLLERIWPALQHVDTSSGALGKAVSGAVDDLVVIIAAAKPDVVTREGWLERLFTAIEEDGVEYLNNVGERWGELCGTPDVASKWADKFSGVVRNWWSEPVSGGWFAGWHVCLSSLLHAGRHQELLDLLALKKNPMWAFLRFGVLALAAEGRIDEAIALAERAGEAGSAMEACEQLLLQAGRQREAWQRYGPLATHRSTYLATYRATAEKYPDIDPDQILQALVDNSPGSEGKWFAAAVRIGSFNLAADLLRRSPTDHNTTLRAAGKHLVAHPAFCADVAMTTLDWLLAGTCRDASAGDVISAIELHVDGTTECGCDFEAAALRVEKLLARPGGDASLKDAAERHLGQLRARRRLEPADVAGSGSRSAAGHSSLPAGTRVSATFLEFLEPLVAELGESDAKALENALYLGVAIWNAVILDASESKTDYLAQMRAAVRGTPQAALVEMLAARKSKHFGEHTWLVGDSGTFRGGNGELRLRVEARSAEA